MHQGHNGNIPKPNMGFNTLSTTNFNTELVKVKVTLTIPLALIAVTQIPAPDVSESCTLYMLPKCRPLPAAASTRKDFLVCFFPLEKSQEQQTSKFHLSGYTSRKEGGDLKIVKRELKAQLSIYPHS